MLRIGRLLLLVLLASVAPLVGARPASAGTVNATLSFTSPVFLGTGYYFAPMVFTGSGAGTSLPGTVTVAPGLFVRSPVYPYPGSEVRYTTPALMPPVSAIGLSPSTAGVGGGSFSGPSLTGTMPIPGLLGLFYGSGLRAGTRPMTVSGTRGVGIGGAPITNLFFGITATLVGGGWSVGQVFLTGAVTTAGSLGTTTRTGADLRTPGGLGVVQLVTPIQLFTNAGPPIPIFGELTLEFVPEPVSALLWLAPALALVALGRGRR